MSTDALDKLLQKRQQLDAKIQAKRNRLRQDERKRDTRRKIIIGAIAMEHADQGNDPEFAATLYRLLNRYVVKPGDRELLDLPPLNDPDQDQALRGDFSKTG